MNSVRTSDPVLLGWVGVVHSFVSSGAGSGGISSAAREASSGGAGSAEGRSWPKTVFLRRLSGGGISNLWPQTGQAIFSPARSSGVSIAFLHVAHAKRIMGGTPKIIGHDCASQPRIAYTGIRRHASIFLCDSFSISVVCLL